MAEEIEEITLVEPTSKKTDSSLNLDNSLEGIQFFYEKNKKVITYGGGALLAIIALFSAYKFYWLPGQEKEAANESFYAQNYFEKDSFNIALNGGKTVRTADGSKPMLGFLEIAESYGSTKTGNLANYYAGICYLRTGKFQEAIDYLQKFSSDDEIVGSIAIGATGDAYMELNQADEAIKFYIKAADRTANSFTTPLYLKKAGLAYESKNEYKEALEVYERIQKEYGKSSEAREIEKYIARTKALGNIE